jgi:hypothetical protein
MKTVHGTINSSQSYCRRCPRNPIVDTPGAELLTDSSDNSCTRTCVFLGGLASALFHLITFTIDLHFPRTPTIAGSDAYPLLHPSTQNYPIPSEAPFALPQYLTKSLLHNLHSISQLPLLEVLRQPYQFAHQTVSAYLPWEILYI